MKTIRKIGMTFMMVFAACTFVACSGDDDGDDSGSGKEYSLEWDKSYTYLDCDVDNDMWMSYLHLIFGDGIRRGAEWELESDQPWVTFRNSRGQVARSLENIPITVGNNRGYDDREANVSLFVSEGVSTRSMSTVKVRQYGYEHYFSQGGSFSFDTDRSEANDRSFTLKSVTIRCIVEIDWGDGNKQLYGEGPNGEYSNYTDISHRYAELKKYTVKVRFGTADNRSPFFFCKIDKGNGLSNFKHTPSSSWNVSNMSTTVVTYDSDGFSIKY